MFVDNIEIDLLSGAGGSGSVSFNSKSSQTSPNGANGGNGGSMTLLMDSESVKKRRLIEDLKEINPLFQNIPIYLSRFGLRVWESI